MEATKRRPSIMGQTALAFLGQSSGYFVAIFTGIIVARSLGPAGKGIIALATLSLSIFTTYGDGLQSAVMYQFGRHTDAEKMIYASALRLIGAVFLPLSVVLFLVGLAVPRYAGLVFVAAAMPFAVYVQVANAFFLVKNEVATTLIVGAFNAFGYAAVVTPALLIWHVDANFVLGTWAAMYALAGTFAFVRISATIPAGSATTPAIIFEQGRFALKSGSVSVASFLNLRIDVFIVGLMLDARTLGIYSLAVATVEMMWLVTRPLGWTTIGRIAVAERSVAIALTAAVTRNILAVSATVGAIAFAVAPLAIGFVYGRAYITSGEVMRWLIPGVIFYAANGSLGYFLMVKEGKPVTMFCVQAGAALACAVITATTLHRIGIFGAALATTVTYCLATLAKAVLFTRATGVPPVSFMVLRAEDIERYRRIIRDVFSTRLRALFLRRA